MLWRCFPLKNIKSATEIKSKNGIRGRIEKKRYEFYSEIVNISFFSFHEFFLPHDRQWRHHFQYTASLNGIGMMGWWNLDNVHIRRNYDTLRWLRGDDLLHKRFIYSRIQIKPSSFQIKEIMSNPAISQIHCLTILFRNNKILEILEISKWKCRVG